MCLFSLLRLFDELFDIINDNPFLTLWKTSAFDAILNYFDSKTFSQLFRKNYFPNLAYCGQRKGGLCNCLVSAKIVLLTKDLSVYIGYVKKCGKFYFVSKQKTFQRKTTRHRLFSILNCGISRHSMLHFSLKLASHCYFKLLIEENWSWVEKPFQIKFFFSEIMQILVCFYFIYWPT